MLAHMVPVIRGIEDIRIVQSSRLVKLVDQTLHHFVNRLESPQPAPLKLVNVLDDRVIQLRQSFNPADCSFYHLVETFIPGDFVILEHVRMSREILRLSEPVRVPGRIMRSIRMRRVRCYRHHPRAVMRQRLVQETESLLFNNLGGVFPVVVHWLVPVPYHPGMVIPIGIRVKQEVGTIEALRIRRVVILLRVGIPEFTNIVRVVPCVLHPDRQVVVIPARLDDLGVTTVGKSDVCDVGIVRHATRPYIGSRRTTQGSRTEMFFVADSLLH